MSTDRPTTFQRVLTWSAMIVAVILLLLGTAMHGFSLEVQQRFWGDIVDRLHGPMTFRFALQPTMAFLAALPDGLGEARHNRVAAIGTKLGQPTPSRERLRQALNSTARVVLLGISMDVIYQLRVFDTFYPAEALMMAILLAVVPYFVFRWLIEHVATWWFIRRNAIK